MKPYELLIFDWDGTLMDSARELVGALQQAIQGAGLPERSPKQMRELIGLSLNDVLARLFPNRDPQQVRAKLSAYRSRYGMRRSRAQLFAPVRETLDALQNQGFMLAVATGKSRRGLNADLESSGTADYFHITRCADESVSKPAPDMLNDILLRTATRPEHALMIGDTEYDIGMARAAGVDGLGVSSGVHDAMRLRRAGAVAVLDSVSELPAWLVGQASGQG